MAGGAAARAEELGLSDRSDIGAAAALARQAVAEARASVQRSQMDVFAAHTAAFGKAAFGGGAVEDILANYHDDAVLITRGRRGFENGILRGKAEIAQFFKEAVGLFREPGATFKMEGEPSFEKDVVRFSWSAETPAVSIRRATDTLIVKDGKIAVQTFSALLDPALTREPSSVGLAGSAAGEAVRRHSTAFRAGDVETVVNDFAPDAVVLTPTGVMRGRDELRKFFSQVLANPNPTFQTTFATADGGRNVGFIEWKADGWPWGTDTFVYDANGLIAVQTFDGVMEPQAR